MNKNCLIICAICIFNLCTFFATNLHSEAGLVGYWKFNEGSGSTAYDTSGQNNHGTIKGASYTSASVEGSALKFSGSSYVDCGAGASLDLTNFTVEVWAKRTKNGAWQVVVGKPGHGISANENYSIWYDTNNNIKCFIGNGATFQAISSGSIDNNWHHIVFTVDGTYLRLYIDKVPVSPVAQTITPAFSSSSLRIGNGISEYPFGGIIDEVRIYNRALDETEVLEHYNTGYENLRKKGSSFLQTLDGDFLGGMIINAVVGKGNVGLTYEENFDDGLAYGFVPNTGAWTVKDGEYYGETCGSSVQFYSLLEGREFTDFTFNFTMILRGKGTYTFYSGCVFRWKDSSNYYRVYNSGSYVYLYKVAGGYSYTVAYSYCPMTNKTKVNYKVVAEGSRIEVWADGAKYIVAEDSSMRSGKIGLWVRDSAYFDNLRINTGMKGEIISSVHDYGNIPRLARMKWDTDISIGTSVEFYFRSASNTYALESTSWTRVNKSDGVVGIPGRYLQYRAVLSSSNRAISPFINEVHIYPQPLERIALNPHSPVKPGNLEFNLYFSEDMDEGSPPEVKFITPFGVSCTCPIGVWRSSKWYQTNYEIKPFLGGGFAILMAKGAVALSDSYVMPLYADSELLFIDAFSLFPERVEFFPNPFSPNQDGLNDWTLLHLYLNESAPVSLNIYNLNGGCVRKWSEEEKIYDVWFKWDGTDDNGKILPIGLYIFQLKLKNKVYSGSLVLVK